MPVDVPGGQYHIHYVTPKDYAGQTVAQLLAKPQRSLMEMIGRLLFVIKEDTPAKCSLCSKLLFLPEQVGGVLLIVPAEQLPGQKVPYGTVCVPCDEDNGRGRLLKKLEDETGVPLTPAVPGWWQPKTTTKH